MALCSVFVRFRRWEWDWYLQCNVNSLFVNIAARVHAACEAVVADWTAASDQAIVISEWRARNNGAGMGSICQSHYWKEYFWYSVFLTLNYALCQYKNLHLSVSKAEFTPDEHSDETHVRLVT